MRWCWLALSGFALGCSAQRNSAGMSQDLRGGDISYQWNLDGMSCAQVPEVRSIHLVLYSDGAALVDASYACSSGGNDGVTLAHKNPGSYTFTLDALDANQKKIYSATGAVTVNGSITLLVDLLPVNPQGSVQVRWSFGAAKKSCAQAHIVGAQGVSQVGIRVDDGAQRLLPCADTSSGQAVEGVDLKLDPGQHKLQVDGFIERSGQAQRWYSKTTSVNVRGATTDLDVALDAVAAPATFVPALDASGTRFSCSAAGVSVLFLQLHDANAACIPKEQNTGGCGRFFDCSAFEAQGLSVDFVPTEQVFDSAISSWSATWDVSIQGWKQYASDAPPLCEGRASASIAAASDTSYAVLMAQQ